MNLVILRLPSWAASSFIVAASFLLGATVASAQEEPAPEEIPAAEAAPADAAPAEAAPAEGADAGEPALDGSTPQEPTPSETSELPAGTESAPADPLGTVPVAVGETPAEVPGDATQLDTIEVTGSRIRRTDYETAQPVTVLSREDIERTGMTNIGDILQRIPAAGSALNRNFNNGGTGTVELDLRNLGPNRVLVLVNGHRWINGSNSSDTAVVDLNSIPASVIERVEVLKDGASAIYGSDAIAGVVNIITRKDFAGAQVRGQAGAFKDGKGFQQQANVSFGSVAENTSMFMDLNFVRQSALFAGDRDISKVPQFGTGFTRGSILGTPRTTNLLVTTGSNASALNAFGNADEPAPCVDLALLVADDGTLPIPLPDTLPGGLTGAALCQVTLRKGETIGADAASKLPGSADRFEYLFAESMDNEKNDAYNFAPINYLLTPFEQYSVFTQLNHKLTDSINLTGQILYNTSRTERALAEEPLPATTLLGPPFDVLCVDETNIYNPWGHDAGCYAGAGAPAGADPGLGIGYGLVGRRLVEAGPRLALRDTKTIFARAGLDGNFDFLNRLFSWDAGFSMGRNDTTSLIAGSVNIERVAKAIGPDADCRGTEVSDGMGGTVRQGGSRGCVPLNMFGGPGTITQDQLDYILYRAAASAEQQVQDVWANITTELSDFTFLPAPVGIAAGLEFRKEQFIDEPDPFVAQGISSTNSRERTEGEFEVMEAYSELAIPILQDKFLADELEASLAARYTEYSTFDPETTGKLGLRWKPYEDLLVRATASQAFRAPSLGDLYAGRAQGFPIVADPCAQEERTPEVEANCGDAAGTTQTAAQLPTFFGGNPNLKPETADTLTFGVVFSPSFIPDFSVTADYFSIKLEDFIASLDPQFVLDSCYETGSDTCQFITRGQGGDHNDGAPISTIEAPTFNFAKVQTSGVDVGLDYVLPLASLSSFFEQLGTFRLVMDSQYLLNYDQFTPNADGTNTKSSFEGTNQGDTPFPRVKATLGLSWNREAWTANWTTRYIGKSTEVCNDGGTPSLEELGLCSDPDRGPKDEAGAFIDGSDDSENEIGQRFYHNVSVGYAYAPWSAQATIGVINLFDKDPPVSTTAFANSYPGTLYEPPGSMQPYIKLQADF